MFIENKTKVAHRMSGRPIEWRYVYLRKLLFCDQ